MLFGSRTLPCQLRNPRKYHAKAVAEIIARRQHQAAVLSLGGEPPAAGLSMSHPGFTYL